MYSHLANCLDNLFKYVSSQLWLEIAVFRLVLIHTSISNSSSCAQPAILAAHVLSVIATLQMMCSLPCASNTVFVTLRHTLFSTIIESYDEG